LQIEDFRLQIGIVDCRLTILATAFRRRKINNLQSSIFNLQLINLQSAISNLQFTA